jgi:hypothetical protein
LGAFANRLLTRMRRDLLGGFLCLLKNDAGFPSLARTESDSLHHGRARIGFADCLHDRFTRVGTLRRLGRFRNLLPQVCLAWASMLLDLYLQMIMRTARWRLRSPRGQQRPLQTLWRA